MWNYICDIELLANMHWWVNEARYFDLGPVPVLGTDTPGLPLHVCPSGVQNFPKKKVYIYMVRETGGSEDDGKKILFLDRLEHLFFFLFWFQFWAFLLFTLLDLGLYSKDVLLLSIITLKFTNA